MAGAPNKKREMREKSGKDGLTFVDIEGIYVTKKRSSAQWKKEDPCNRFMDSLLKLNVRCKLRALVTNFFYNTCKRFSLRLPVS